MKTLYYGDNLQILREHFADESIDLIYLDPPFNSNVDYNVIFREHTDTSELPTAQILAFEDTWTWSIESEQALVEMPTLHGRLAEFMDFTVRYLNRNSMSAYLINMAIRLVELHRVLTPTGSLYLHCDPTASHYLKLILDIVFDVRNFRSEIKWKRTSSHNDARKNFGNVSDTIFFYTKSDEYTFTQLYAPYSEGQLKKYSGVDPDGRRFTTRDLRSPQSPAEPYLHVQGLQAASKRLEYFPGANGATGH